MFPTRPKRRAPAPSMRTRTCPSCHGTMTQKGARGDSWTCTNCGHGLPGAHQLSLHARRRE